MTINHDLLAVLATEAFLLDAGPLWVIPQVDDSNWITNVMQKVNTQLAHRYIIAHEQCMSSSVRQTLRLCDTNCRKVLP